jgi:hypothetical protein
MSARIRVPAISKVQIEMVSYSAPAQGLLPIL